MADYVVALIHEEDSLFGISFPDFPGVVSGGASIDESLRRGAETLAFHIAGMIEDGDALPVLRSMSELRGNPEFRDEFRDAVAVLVPIELPGKAVRVNISMDERLLGAIDRAAQARGESRSSFLAMAAKDRIRGAS